MSLIPIVLEKNGKSERAYDIYNKLLQEWIVLIGTHIDEIWANTVIA